MIAWLLRLSERVDRWFNPAAWAQHDAHMEWLRPIQLEIEVNDILFSEMHKIIFEDVDTNTRLLVWEWTSR